MTEVGRWCRVTGVKHAANLQSAVCRAAAALTRSGGGGRKTLLIALATSALLLALLTLAQAATPAPTSRYVAVDAGRDHTCTLHITGRVRCWGNGAAELLDVPEGRYSAISAGEWHN